MKRLLMLSAAVMLAIGCTSLSHLQAPKLQVVGVNYVGGDGHHQQLMLNVHVTNPNNRSIAVRSINYELALAGTHVAQGESGEPFSVPALGESDFKLGVDADLNSLLRVIGAHYNDPAVDYEVSGTLHLAEGVLREFPFKSHGQVPLR